MSIMLSSTVQVSLHDVYLVHGSEANRSPDPLRRMNLRFMSPSSVFNRDLSTQMAKERGLVDHAFRTLFACMGRISAVSTIFGYATER